MSWKIGDDAVYKGYFVKIISGHYPRHGHERVKVERLSDGRRFVVQKRRLSKPVQVGPFEDREES